MPEFRREAVWPALTSGRTRREIAEDLGIDLSTLTRWLGQERDVSEPSEAPLDLHAEVKRLQRKDAVLKHLSRIRFLHDDLKHPASFAAGKDCRRVVMR